MRRRALTGVFAALAAAWLMCSTVLTPIVFAQSAAGLRWTPPKAWKSEPELPMRAATYTIPAAAGDKAGSECIVSFFGKGQGGTVDANIERWKGQFRGADGKPAVAKVAKRTVSGVPVTTIDVAGEYSGMGGPMATNARSVPGYRLLGAIVEGPGGTVFFKFSGPAKTVAANQAAYDQMIGSIQKP